MFRCPGSASALGCCAFRGWLCSRFGPLDDLVVPTDARDDDRDSRTLQRRELVFNPLQASDQSSASHGLSFAGRIGGGALQFRNASLYVFNLD